MLGQWPIITPQWSKFCGVTLVHSEKTPPITVVLLLLSPLLWKDKFFSRILPIYFKHTYFLVHLLMAISTKQTRILNWSDNETYNWCYRIICFDSAKRFLTNYSYMWCVTLIPWYPNDINSCCSGVIIINFGHISTFLTCLLLWHCDKPLNQYENVFKNSQMYIWSSSIHNGRPSLLESRLT